jgi:homoserine O-acetyltransferase
MLGHITYLSDEAMGKKFGRELRSGSINYGYDVEFQIESYLRYQSSNFVERFDANTYLLMTKALDYFDPAQHHDNDLAKTVAPITAKALVMSFTSDWRFSPERSEEIVNALLSANKEVTYAEIEANQGHDAFLMPIPRYMEIFKAYMQGVAAEIAA